MTSLEKKGFILNNGGNHHHYILVVNGKYTHIRTKISRGSSHIEIGEALIAKMSKDLKIPKNKFLGLVECPYSYDQYISDLIREGNLLL
jgi:hypothetical protein